MELPFQHLNLCRNPFCAVSKEEHAELAVVDIDEYVGYLQRPGRVVEFRGGHGRGKTTHLLAICRAFSGAPYIRGSRREGKIEVPESPVIGVDEGQRLSRRQRRSLFVPKRSYVVSTHEPMQKVYDRVGLESRDVELEGLKVDRLLEIADRRIEAARRDEGTVPGIGKDTAEVLIEEFGDDLRSIEEHLYEVFQRLEEVRTVEPADVLATR